MQRHKFQHDGLTLSYLDAEGDGQPLIALHAHWLEATSFVPLAKDLAPEWRVIALDQRGHGYSGHAKTYTRDDYLGDLEAFLRPSLSGKGSSAGQLARRCQRLPICRALIPNAYAL